MISVSVYSVPVSISEVEMRTDLLGTAVSFAQLVADRTARLIEEALLEDIEAQQERDRREAAERRAAAAAYRAITDDIIARLEQIKSIRPLTVEDRDRALDEHKRRCALVPNPPLRVWP